MTWDPDTYLSRAAERTRPAADLLARIADARPERIVDLGCGPGNSTALLCAHWPEAEVLGVDSDPAMLARARQSGLAADWQQADAASWEPAQRPDLIFANALLQWLPDHERLIPQLLSFLAPGGVLALQMPRNFSAASHRELRALAAEEPWATPLEGVLRDAPVGDAGFYHGLLRGRAAALDIWETIYCHALDGPDPVLGWLRGTALTPLRDRLGQEDYEAFEAALAPRLRAAYPAASDGVTLFPFRRLFLVARRAG